MSDDAAEKKGAKPAGAGKFKAGDKVRHIPSGTETVVASVTEQGPRCKGLAGVINPLALEKI